MCFEVAGLIEVDVALEFEPGPVPAFETGPRPFGQLASFGWEYDRRPFEKKETLEAFS